MSYVTIAAARAAASLGGVTAGVAIDAMRRAAAGAPPSTQYDIFLSHSSEDASVIAGVKFLLQREGTTVYVYWAEEDQNEGVTAATAARLRTRMMRCRALVYASSAASRNSKWMPWELGYFDGLKPGHVAILPLVASSGATFTGQEYLGLYPHIEDLDWTGGTRGLGILTDTAQRMGTPLSDFVRTGVAPDIS